MNQPLPKLRGLRSAAAVLLAAFAAAVVPPPPMNVAAWASAHRVVAAESGSPLPGRWKAEVAPYITEVMECLSPTHPCRDVVAMKSAQTAFSEAGLNFFGASADEDPCPFLIVVPTIEEAKKYNRIKLQPTIDATPRLAGVVADVKSRDSDSSTALFKQFRRGYCVLTGANASSGLQMISARKIIFEEVSEYPADTGGRGDPVEQALTRATAWSPYKPKRYYVSTPNMKGACRITALFEASDQRRYYVPCPVCGDYQVLRFANLKWTAPVKPFGAFFACESNGCVISAAEKRAMVARGVWIRTFPGAESNPPPPAAIAPAELERWRARPAEGRDPGFHLWQAYSPFVGWDELVEKWLKAEGDPQLLKVFWQQQLGEAWEEKGEAPPAEKLVECRTRLAWQKVPAGALLLTGMADVQGDRIEYGVYAWGPALRHGWHIDGGIIIGDPATESPWLALDGILSQTYEDARGNRWDLDALGVDAGFLSSHVYRWAGRHAMPRQAVEPHNPPATRHVFALDGRPGWRLPALGRPSPKDVDFAGKKIGAVLLWPTGTFDLKAELYARLRNLLIGQDEAGQWQLPVLQFGERCDLGFFEQMTAESLEERIERGVPVKIWINLARKRNEQLDIAVGALALAHHLADSLSSAQWQDLAARRALSPEKAQADFAALWDPGLAIREQPAAVHADPGPPAPRVRIDDAAVDWIDPARDWWS